MQVEGRNPILEALRAGVHVRWIRVARGAGEKGTLAEIVTLADKRGVRIHRVERKELDDSSESGAHQGVMADIAFHYRPWQEAVAAARANGEAPLLVALDGVTDPQNAGAIIRSAHVFGAHAVLLPSRRSVSITPSVVKASAGAVWHLAIDDVGNLERTLAECMADGIWIAALDGSAEIEVSNCPLLSEPLALVVGSEGSGVSRLLLERADVTVKIAQSGHFDSLNASTATAIALYVVARSRV